MKSGLYVQSVIVQWQEAGVSQMTLEEIKPGMVVQLASGGPRMTVDNIGVHNKVYCEFFTSAGENKVASFSPVVLVPAQLPPLYR